LGEALAQAGRKKEALEAIRRSLEINPKNSHGLEMKKMLEAKN
jgi:Flp pilus assembly protein TadD